MCVWLMPFSIALLLINSNIANKSISDFPILVLFGAVVYIWAKQKRIECMFWRACHRLWFTNVTIMFDSFLCWHQLNSSKCGAVATVFSKLLLQNVIGGLNVCFAAVIFERQHNCSYYFDSLKQKLITKQYLALNCNLLN